VHLTFDLLVLLSMPTRTPKSKPVPAATRLRELSHTLLKVAGDMGENVSSKDAHKLRTSIRRIEVAMETSEKVSGAKKLQRRLDGLRKVAGHVRDIDVQTDLLLGLDAGDYSSDCSTLKNALLRRRDRLETKAAAKISKELEKGLEDRLEKAASAIENSKPPVRLASRDKVEHVRQQYIEFTAEIPLDGDPLHNLRKATKRLRYRLEAVPGRESKALAEEMKTVQDAIGEWHDWATLTEEAEKRLESRSIAFIAFLRSRAIAKRHEARRITEALRHKLVHLSSGKKPPMRASAPTAAANTRAAR
jgi:CHAD domain-containing protein